MAFNTDAAKYVMGGVALGVVGHMALSQMSATKAEPKKEKKVYAQVRARTQTTPPKEFSSCYK
jgi:hypothetical protein